MTFEEESLIGIGNTLGILECDNCNITSISNFHYLECLVTLKMKYNKI